MAYDVADACFSTFVEAPAIMHASFRKIFHVFAGNKHGVKNINNAYETHIFSGAYPVVVSFLNRFSKLAPLHRNARKATLFLT